jgi:transposase
MIDRGVPAEAIMAALDLGRSTFFKWKALYRSGGLDALAVRPIPGGESKLTDEQTRQLWSWLTGRDPRQFGFDFVLWTRKIVAQLIRDRFGVEMTPQGVGKLLRRLGLSPQRPLYRAYQQNPEAVAAWREVTFPAIRAQARREGAELYFADESWVRTDHHSGTTWATVGQTPVVTVTGERDSVNMISAVTPRGVLKFETYRGRFTSIVFIEFLKKLLRDASAPVYVIVDNATQHTANAVKEFVASTEGRLKIFFLPPYSPELNPDEWVWNNVKNDQLGKKPVLRKSEFFELVTQALERLQSLPDVVMGFFRDPSLAYINDQPVH